MVGVIVLFASGQNFLFQCNMAFAKKLIVHWHKRKSGNLEDKTGVSRFALSPDDLWAFDLDQAIGMVWHDCRDEYEKEDDET